MSKKSSKAKVRKSTKRTTAQAGPVESAAETKTLPKLIPELAALKPSAKLAPKLESLTESEQDTVLNYVNTGMKINDAYQRTIAGKPEQDQQQTDHAAENPAPIAPQAECGQAQEAETAPATPTEAEMTATGETALPGEPAAQPEAEKPSRASKAKKDTGPKKMSAIDAAAKILAEDGGAPNCQEMIDAMAAKGCWSSPGGKTPHATLYSAILREISTKGNESRFKKTERGKFAIGNAS